MKRDLAQIRDWSNTPAALQQAGCGQLAGVQALQVDSAERRTGLMDKSRSGPQIELQLLVAIVASQALTSEVI